eukprot:TRINITY_DN54785_c0_g1_i2.p1 TRINITY_DN54785_c0_g1~~TRINITY_DN54785_c0_g1_i2.p1  ORF type:complete len:105 (+),score=27.15 TRINITY_DN54785_c0_g1_i2:246-560(+)
MQDERSQHKNRAKGMRVLQARIYEAERQRVHAERAQARSSLVGSGDRSERIRTYNFAQDRITDHRVSLSMTNMDSMLRGELLEEFRDALAQDERMTRIAELEEF